MTVAAGYSGTPLAAKLGIKAGSTVLLDGAPAGFELDELPPDVTVQRRVGSRPYDVIVCFCPDLERLERRWAVLHSRTTVAGGLWVAWPKRASGVATDLTDNVVRDFVLRSGRVDVKVCAIDAIWSGMKNVVRVSDR
jgi:hypothetical protein